MPTSCTCTDCQDEKIAARRSLPARPEDEPHHRVRPALRRGSRGGQVAGRGGVRVSNLELFVLQLNLEAVSGIYRAALCEGRVEAAAEALMWRAVLARKIAERKRA